MTESEARSLVAGVGLVICSLIAALAWGQTALNYVMVAWMLWLTWDRSNLHETVTNDHDEQLGLLAGRIQALAEWLGVEVTDPEDDSPETMAEEEALPPGQIAGSPCTGTDRLAPPGGAEPYRDEMPTDEIPVCPPTVPDGIPLQVQSALIEQRPSPVPRKSADWVEAELTKVRARIDAAREAS